MSPAAWRIASLLLPGCGVKYRRFHFLDTTGARMKYEAVYPDGTSEILLNVPNYSFDWQTTYQLAQPKLMPAGTEIIISGAFDNSVLNHHNPDPGRLVTWGEQTTQEMFIGFLSYTLAE